MSIYSLERLREAVRRHVGRFGAPAEAPMRETMLIRNGLYCGRRFECDCYQVVWFIEEDELKFFGPCGDVLWVASTSDVLEPAEEKGEQERRAA